VEWATIGNMLQLVGQKACEAAKDRAFALLTTRRLVSINGKREGLEREDLLALASSAGIKAPQANQTLDRVTASVRRWPEFAEAAGVPDERIGKIRRAQLVAL
jgi:hypothetical protein